MCANADSTVAQLNNENDPLSGQLYLWSRQTAAVNAPIQCAKLLLQWPTDCSFIQARIRVNSIQ